jgi:hypothetical protein
MVGIRVEPDDNDIVVWRLDEATAPFVNSSTSPSAPSHAVSDLGTLSGTVFTQQPTPFAASGVGSGIQLLGNNSGSPRNFIGGANAFLPQPPMTVSFWIYQRAYDTTGFTQHGLSKQTTTGVWSGTTFNSIFVAQNRRYAGLPTQFDFGVTTSSGGGGGSAVAVAEMNVSLNTWSHVGFTYNGTTVLSYINGNNVGSATASPTGNVFYSGTPGPWFFGAIPSGSGNPEEGQCGVCDIRVANVVRDQAYFQNIYQNAILNYSGTGGIITTYYKLRAFDLFNTTVPLYWVSTTVSYAGAPASPSGYGLGPIEVVEIWRVSS